MIVSQTRAVACVAVVLASLLYTVRLSSQNVVSENDSRAHIGPASFDEDTLQPYLWRAPFHRLRSRRPEPDVARVERKLDRHVSAFLDGFPFKPFHFTLGISGHEVYFDHPDEMVYALSIATPYLTEKTAERVRVFLRDQVNRHPPYERTGFDPREGRPRESYIVPDALRATRRRSALNAFGVYAFWAYVRYVQDDDALRRHWPRIRTRMAQILDAPCRFDLQKRHEKDEAERLTGDLAGVVGCMRLARAIGDGKTERTARLRAVEMLSIRINLDRVNPRILETSRTTASHALHMSKLARYVDLVPCVGAAIREQTEEVAAARLACFRRARNAWFVAFGPRLIGGENYTSPLHLSRAIFDAAVFVEARDADALLAFVDIPWCQGDFYFVVKCAYALWAARGRPWADHP